MILATIDSRGSWGKGFGAMKMLKPYLGGGRLLTSLVLLGCEDIPPLLLAWPPFLQPQCPAGPLPKTHRLLWMFVAGERYEAPAASVLVWYQCGWIERRVKKGMEESLLIHKEGGMPALTDGLWISIQMDELNTDLHGWSTCLSANSEVLHFPGKDS